MENPCLLATPHAYELSGFTFEKLSKETDIHFAMLNKFFNRKIQLPPKRVRAIERAIRRRLVQRKREIEKLLGEPGDVAPEAEEIVGT